MTSELMIDVDAPVHDTAAEAASEGTVALLVERLARCGALGVVCVDLTNLAAIGARLGDTAYEDAFSRVERAVTRCLGPMFRSSTDIIARGIGVRGALSIWFARPRGETEFYEGSLAALARVIDDNLVRLGPRVVYPYRLDDRHFAVGSSLVLQDQAARPDTLLHDAMTRALERARVAARVAHLAAEDELLRVLLGERVESVFEPIIDLMTDAVLGYEALARGPWGTRFESPMELFTVAEQSGLTFELDCLCRRAALRGATGRLPASASLFLNCLPSAIHDPAFSGPELQRTLETCGLEPSRIVLEISERETLENPAILRRACDMYRGVGIRIALDDVGSGYASMAAAMDIAPDIMKIDLSIVRGIDVDPARQALVSSLCTLAEKMGSAVVAEGVEHESERGMLVKLGVSMAQGHLFGRPQPLAAHSQRG